MDPWDNVLLRELCSEIKKIAKDLKFLSPSHIVP